MKVIARHIAALSTVVLIALSAGAARAANCDLIFEFIPSKDAGPIIGQAVKRKLGAKNFAQWQEFTAQYTAGVAKFLGTSFFGKAEFGEPHPGIGGFEGRSSPNVIIGFDFAGEPNAQGQGKVADEIAAAVGYGLIQDGTVVQCEKSLGSYGGPVDVYSIAPGEGFKVDLGAAFVKMVYSAVALANDAPSIGYTFDGEQMTMLNFGDLPGQLKATNGYFGVLFKSPVSIAIANGPTLYSIYQANDWAASPNGAALRLRVPTMLGPALSDFRAAYVKALAKFAGGG